MFITQVLCLKRIKWVPKVRPHGHLYRGKDRIVRGVTAQEIRCVRNALDIEDRNMFYLRHPFLTAAEYKYVGRDFVKSRLNMLNATRDRKFDRFCKTVEHRSIEAFFRQRLPKSNNWE